MSSRPKYITRKQAHAMLILERLGVPVPELRRAIYQELGHRGYRWAVASQRWVRR